MHHVVRSEKMSLNLHDRIERILSDPTNEQHRPQSIDAVLHVVSTVVSENEHSINDISSGDIECCLGLQCQFGPGEGDMTKAIYWYRKSAERSYLLAVWVMKYCYLEGLGVKKDYRMAEVFSDMFSKQLQKHRCEIERDELLERDLSYKLLEQMSSSGRAEVQLLVGLCFHYGLVYEQAVKWYRLSANQNHAHAQFSLGICYSFGQGVEKSYEEALKWFRLSAQQGNTNAQYHLGVFYYYGKGIERSDEEAVRWFRLSSEQGNAEAQKALYQLLLLQQK